MHIDKRNSLVQFYLYSTLNKTLSQGFTEILEEEILKGTRIKRKRLLFCMTTGCVGVLFVVVVVI